jgi:hypothetical protein
MGWTVAVLVDSPFCLVLSQVTFCSGIRVWKMLANKCGSESRPSGVQSPLIGLWVPMEKVCPCLERRTASDVNVAS